MNGDKNCPTAVSTASIVIIHALSSGRHIVLCQTGRRRKILRKLLSNLGRLAGLDDGQLKSWLYRVSTNIALDHLRRAKHETPVDAPISEDIEDSALPLDEEVERRRKAAKVRSAIDKLDETSRKVILLHYYAGMTVREISACTGISEGTVKSRLMKARKRLAVMLGEEAADEKKRKKK